MSEPKPPDSVVVIEDGPDVALPEIVALLVDVVPVAPPSDVDDTVSGLASVDWE